MLGFEEVEKYDPELAQAISLVIDDMEKNKEEAMALVKSLTDKYPLYE